MNSSAPSNNSVVVAGVLSKFTNRMKGWRDRLFILDNGKFSYYKIRGAARTNVFQLLKTVSDGGRREVRIIGAETTVIHRDDAKNKNGQVYKAAAEYEVQGLKLRESSTESHKFYVTGPNEVQLFLKCETPDDRRAWISALSSAKQTVSRSEFDFVGPGGAVPPLGRVSTVASAQASRTRLLTELTARHGLTPTGVEVLGPVLQDLHAQLLSLQERVQDLTSEVQELSEARRVLETNVVADSQSVIGKQMSVSSSHGEDDEDEDTRVPGSLGYLEYDSEDDIPEFSHRDPEGDAFYEAREEALAASTRRSSMSDATTVLAAKARRAPRATDINAPDLRTPPGSSPGGASALGTSLRRSLDLHSASRPHVSSGSAGLEGGPSGATALAELIPPAVWRESPPLWTKDPVADPPRRDHMPKPVQEEKSVSLWSIIKECVGKDLTRICLPVFFNEPLSALQKMTEEVEYSALLDRAAESPRGSIPRLMLVAAFAISGYSSTNGRTCKPFNPLLGETYEYVDAKKGMRFIAEKVIHHPTVLAAHAAGRGWTLDCDIEGKSRFWGRCIELKPVGHLQVSFHDGEVVTWNKVTTTINNLILGKIYVDHGGIMRVTSNVSKYDVKVRFKDGGMLTRGKHQVSGAVTDGPTEMSKHTIEGTWDGKLTADLGQGPETIWTASAPPKDPTRHNLTAFAITLNELTPGLQDKLAPTDCRLRPDQAFLEAGRYDEANFEKQRLEKKQRAARKEAEEGVPIHPRWFTPVPGAVRGDALAYKYAGGYWESRDKGQFDNCRDIFGS